MKINQVNPATAQALARAAELLRYQNKQMEIKRMEDNLEFEKQRIKRLQPTADKGNNIDVYV